MATGLLSEIGLAPDVETPEEVLDFALLKIQETAPAAPSPPTNSAGVPIGDE
jgi:hypothetical protein